MNKTEFVREIAEQANLTTKQADAAYSAFVETVRKALKGGDKVQLVGFGNFELRARAARTGINPLTKQKIKIKASKTPVFKAGKAFKELF